MNMKHIILLIIVLTLGFFSASLITNNQSDIATIVNNTSDLNTTNIPKIPETVINDSNLSENQNNTTNQIGLLTKEEVYNKFLNRSKNILDNYEGNHEITMTVSNLTNEDGRYVYYVDYFDYGEWMATDVVDAKTGEWDYGGADAQVIGYDDTDANKVKNAQTQYSIGYCKKIAREFLNDAQTRNYEFSVDSMSVSVDNHLIYKFNYYNKSNPAHNEDIEVDSQTGKVYDD